MCRVTENSAGAPLKRSNNSFCETTYLEVHSDGKHPQHNCCSHILETVWWELLACRIGFPTWLRFPLLIHLSALPSQSHRPPDRKHNKGQEQFQRVRTTRNFKAVTSSSLWCPCPHLFSAWQTLTVTMASQKCRSVVCEQLSRRWMWQPRKGQVVFSEAGKGQGSNRDSFCMKCSGSPEQWVVSLLQLGWSEEGFILCGFF